MTSISVPGLQRPEPAPPLVAAEHPADFSTRRVGSLVHAVDRHPLMQLPSLARLAHTLAPLRQCRFIKPGTIEGSAFFHRPKTWDGRGIDEVFERIEEPGSWVALYNVESDPAYAALLRQVVDGMAPSIHKEQRRVMLVTGFIFISAPPSVTPFHIDRENNFWLQIRGRKTLHVWDHTDRLTVPARSVEDYIVDSDLSGVRLGDDAVARSRTFDVGPGQGVYFPSTSPHMTRTTTDWVAPGDGVSVSIGVNFYTDLTRRHARVHQFNKLLRSVGIAPQPPGLSPLRDAVKAPLGRWVGKARYRLRRVPGPPGAT